MTAAMQAVFDYHQRTKHHLNVYAKGPESLDWDDQPNPFRRFLDCELIRLPAPGADLDCLFSSLDQPASIAPQTVNLRSLGLMLELAMGLSAWKEFGPDRWALRCNPSSGNLHPTEAYLISTDNQVLAGGVYHYHSHDHVLEQRGRFTIDGPAAGEVYLGLSSVHWREAWKYGERSFRYCQHDVGHALAALSYAAAGLGWRLELLSEVADADLARWLGLDRAEDFVAHESETPDLLLRINPQQAFDALTLNRCLSSTVWFGKAQALQGHHFYRWPIIDEVTQLTEKPATPIDRRAFAAVDLASVTYDQPTSQLIRQRRSAQRFNPKADLVPLETFQRLLSAMLPSARPPFSSWNWSVKSHLLVFVHRIDNLDPGLYFLVRDLQHLPALQQALSPEFEWQQQSMPLAFYRLRSGDYRQLAKKLSCHQSIASDSAFSLGMLTQFAEPIKDGPWHYRRLFWECGMLGQILYLEAEAAGLRGTGIGCFFDDEVHALLGLQNNDWQSLYHFTVGSPLEDSRIQTLPPYQHLS